MSEDPIKKAYIKLSKCLPRNAVFGSNGAQKEYIMDVIREAALLSQIAPSICDRLNNHNRMTKTDTEANGADKEHSSPVPCYQPYFVGYRVCDVLKSKIGEIIKIDGSRCLVDWGMYDTWEKADNLYCEESYYEDDEQDFS